MKKHFFILTLLAFTLASCEKNEFDFNNNANNESNNGLIIRKVRKLENPYSVSNMKKAYTALQQEGLMKVSLNIEATHLYVRFLPKDSVESELLRGDTTLTLFSYPLDYELTEGEKFIDSTLIGNNFTWLYTRVPVGYTSPISQFEIIEHLFLPTLIENDIQGVKSQKASNTKNNNWWNILENKSLELTGNNYSAQKCISAQKIQKAANASSWFPKATIKVYDDKLARNVALQGIRVRARWWFNWEDGITNALGTAVMSGSFKGKVNWSIVWEDYFWDIRDGWISQAYYNGPNGSESNWTLEINSGKNKYYATIHRAAYRMFYKNNLNTKNPFLNSFNPPSIKLCCIDEPGTGIYYTWKKFVPSPIQWFFPDIKIYCKNRKTEEILRTTIHELSHIFHCYSMFGNEINFLTVNDVLVESWANAMAYYIVHLEYSDYGYKTEFVSDWQYWPFKNFSNEYSPLFIDLIDDYNQRVILGVRSDDFEYANDSIKGYDLATLNTILIKSYGLESLSRNLKKQKPTGVTDTQIDNLINSIDKYYEKK
jgi:hypothetical protein